MPRTGRLLAWGVTLFLWSCGGDESTPPSKASVGSDGGTLVLPDGASITLAAGAVPEGIRVTGRVQTSAAPAPSGLQLEGKVYVFEPHGTQFAEPAVIKIPATADGSAYVLDDDDDTSWAEVTSAKLRGGFHELSVSHISLFAELASSAGAGGAGAGGAQGEGGTGNDGGSLAQGGSAGANAAGAALGGEGGAGGDGSTAITPKPGTICAGSMHGCAIVEGGQVACWGAGYSGQLGDGVVHQEEPQGVATPAIVPGVEGVVQLACRADYTVALLDDGSLLSWGTGQSGQMGDGSTNAANAVPRPGLIDRVVQVSAGGSHVCALDEDARVFCWGNNTFGQAWDNGGDATLPQYVTPQPVLTLTDVIEVQAGMDHTCALLSDGTVKCWGNNDQGQVGLATGESWGTPQLVPELDQVVQLAAGYSYTCALQSTGAITCWGLGEYGQLGDGSFHEGAGPNPTRSVVSGDEHYVRVSASNFHTCGIEQSGGVRCWGMGDTGRLGDGSYYAEEPYSLATPQVVTGLDQVEDLYLGGDNSCARRVDQSVWCWGWGVLGALGNGNLYDPEPLAPPEEHGSAVPVRVLNIP